MLAAAAALVAAPAVAQQATQSQLDLSWEAPAGCPQLRAVRERIRAIAGPPTQRESHLQGVGRITRDDGRFHLRLVVRDGANTGERNIASASCEDLTGAAAVAIGLLIRSDTPVNDESLGRGEASQSPNDGAPISGPGSKTSGPGSSTSPTAGAAGAEQPSDDLAPRESSTSRHWRALLWAPMFVTDLGPLPSPSFGLALGVGIKYDDWRLLLVGKRWLHQSVGGRDLPAFSASVGRQSLDLSACRAARFGRFELGPCVGAGVEQVAARGAGAGVAPLEPSAAWLAASASALGTLRILKALALVAAVGGRIETSRPRISIDGLGELRQFSPFALSTAVGAEWSF
jgi:hypothetical protein